MRAAGALLTVLALVLVQAPWIVCGCADDAGCTPIFAGSLTHGDSEPHEDCCNPAAHLAHGSRHAHGRHCHHHHAHHHANQDADLGDEPEMPEEPDDHVGFKMPMATMPAPVQLGSDLAPALVLALLFDDAALPSGGTRVPARANDPPGVPIAPSVTTERLLL